MTIRIDHSGPIITPIVVGLLVGAFIVYATGHLDTKWLAAFVLLIAGLSGLIGLRLLTNKTQDILIFGSIALFPIYYDISFFFHKDPAHFVFANGITLRLYDVMLLPLLAGRLLHLVVPGRFGPQEEPTRPNYKILVLFGTFIGLNALSSVVAVEPFMTFSAISWYIKLFIIYLLFYPTVLKRPEHFRYIAYMFAIILLIEGVVVLEQKFVGKIFTAEFLGRDVGIKTRLGTDELLVRPGGTTGHPNALAMLLNMLIPTVTYFMLNEKIAWRKLLMGLALALGLMSLLFTASRGAWMGLSAGMFLSTILYRYKRGQSIVATTVKLALMGILAFGLLLASSQTFRDRLFKYDQGSAEERVPLAKIAINTIRANPIMGVGTNNYTFVMQRYDNTEYFLTLYYDFPVHNTYLLLAAEAGIPTLIIWIITIFTLIITAIRQSLRLHDDLSRAALGTTASLTAWVVHNAGDLNPIYMNQPLWLLFGIVTALSILHTPSQART